MKPYYEADGITIYHGDCREVLPLACDVIVTDPPYGISYSYRFDGPLKGVSIQGDSSVALRDWVLNEAQSNTPALIFGTWRAPRPSGLRAVLVWDKGSWGMGDLSLPWTASWEEIYVRGDGFSGRRGNGVLRYSALQTTTGREHPNQKPTALLTALVAKCPDGIVLDPFMGSGTTLVAAKNLGRSAIGVEIEERYCEIAARRLSQGVLPFTSTAAPGAAPAGS